MLDLLLLGQKTAPDFFWDARAGILPPGSTFTRGSSGWSFNNAGVLTQSGNNVARFDHDPATLTPLGYLAERQSTNAVTQSQNFSTGWTASNVTLTNNAVTAPDGTTTAGTLLLNSGSALHQLQSSASFAYSSGNVLGMSCFVKEITGGSWVQFTFGGNSGFNFQPSSGAVGSSLTGSQSNVVARQLANGWWRISFLFTASATTSSSLAVSFVSASNATPAPTITGDGTSTVAVWGFQVDSANCGVTSYIPTAGSTVTRSGDLLTVPVTAISRWNPVNGCVIAASYCLHTNTGFGGAAQTQDVVYITDTGTNYFEASGQSGAAAMGLLCRRSDLGFQLNIAAASNPVPTPFLRRKAAWGLSPNRGQIAVDGAMVVTGAGPAIMPVAPTQIDIGGPTLSSLCGTLETISIYSGSRSDGFVLARTQ
ncbi:MAG TPA: hypothetical protein VKY24_22675 [Reyranella sp.]|nr:hypothetical protein [Reyranella sp.]